MRLTSLLAPLLFAVATDGEHRTRPRYLISTVALESPHPNKYNFCAVHCSRVGSEAKPYWGANKRQVSAVA